MSRIRSLGLGALVAMLAATAFPAAAMAAKTTSSSVLELTGAEVVPGPGDPDGRGAASIILGKSGLICVFVETRNLAVPLTGHIHQAPVGATGPVVVDLFSAIDDPDPSNCVRVDPSLVRAILNKPGGYYLDLHNAEFPGGALRGQFAERDGSLFAGLSGDDVVPGPGDPHGQGGAFLSMNTETGTLCFQLNNANLAAPFTGGHVHQAPAGEVGPVVVELFGVTSDTDPFGCLSVDPSLLRAIKKDPRGYYVDIHNEEFPGGAVRGQLLG